MKITVKENIQEIDWSQRQLILSPNGNVLLTTGNESKSAYEGIVLRNIDGGVNVGSMQYFTKCEGYTLFTGSITLQND